MSPHIQNGSLINLIITLLLLLSSSFFLSAKSNVPFSCDPSNPSTNSLPFCNQKLSFSDRVKDLVSRLSLDEKVAQLVNTAAAIPRLNISAYEWWSEALHGVSRHGRGANFTGGTVTSATMFPQIILSAASFDSNLWFRIAQAIGEESRAIFNAGQLKGMTFWAPNINIFRDPRWGRGQETPGEDPLVAGKYAVAYVRGIQGDSFEGGQLKDDHLKASACCKHYTAHDLDNWNGVNRYTFDAKVTKQDMADTFQPPFKACVQQGQASGIMCAYNRVNGVPNCADYNLLTETARDEWGFQGYIVSDCDAVAIIHDEQGYAKEPEEAVADVLQAGTYYDPIIILANKSMDVNCGSYLIKHTKSAVQKRNILESDIDRALQNLFSIRMRLGLFNGDPRKLEYGNISRDQVCSQKHRELALEAALSGIVLLKNDNSLLPFSKTKTHSLAVIGPTANSSGVFLGNYEGPPCKNITILQALHSYSSSIIYHQGCDSVNCTSASIDDVTKMAKEVDYVILVMGLDQTQEREKHDRVELGLPGDQEVLIASVAKAAKRAVVLVLLSGGPVDISFAKENPKIGSILWAGYPGEAGGTAVAQTLFGDHNPGGRLPVTWYPKDFVKIPMTNMRMRPNPSTGYPGRTYRFYDGPKVYEFGYGLSYSKYSYEFVSVSENKLPIDSLSHRSAVKKSGTVHYLSVSELGTKSCDSMTFFAHVKISNHGEMKGKHPVLLFVRNENVGNGNPPRKQLVGFQSVSLSAGKNVEVEFVVSPCEHMSYADEEGRMVIEEGSRYLTVGDEEYRFDVVF